MKRSLICLFTLCVWVSCVFAQQDEFNPPSPGDPSPNFFDASTGELIIDRFTSGHLKDAVEAIVPENKDHVIDLKVIGHMESSDYDVVNDLKHVEVIDISRTTGLSKLPINYPSKMTRLLLPASIDTIDSYHPFYGASNLKEIILYALVPPVWDKPEIDYSSYAMWGINIDDIEIPQTPFDDLSHNVILRVPAEALALYQADENWSYFTILPIDQYSISVLLPEDDAALYKNMFLELQDAKSGEVNRFVITNRVEYTLRDVFKNATYHLSLRNGQGRCFGQKTITLSDRDTIVSFTDLLQPVDLAMRVFTDANEEVTDNVTVSWLDKEKKLIRRTSQLSGQVEGDTLYYSISLDETLSSVYYQVDMDTAVVNPLQPQVVYALKPFAAKTWSGIVTDEHNVPIADASVVLTQTLNGKYTKQFRTSTLQDGSFSVDALEAPTQLIVYESKYAKQTVRVEAEEELQHIVLEPLSGTRIHLNFLYRPVSTIEGLTLDHYGDIHDLEFVIFNRTQGQPITEFEVQNNAILLLSALQVHDSVEIHVSSRTNAIIPMETGARVREDNTLSMELELIETGGLQVLYGEVPDEGVVAILYDNEGKRIQQSIGNQSKQVQFNHLVGGNYTIISMQKDHRYNGFKQLSELSESALQDDKDYKRMIIEIQDQKNRIALIDTVPYINTQLVRYTDDNTSFSVDKMSIVSGNYLTLRGQISFNSQYKGNVTDVNLVVDLPNGVNLVENAVMNGSRIVPYMYKDNRLTVPLLSVSESFRFCVIPTISGSMRIDANIEFKDASNDVTETIGSVTFVVEDASIKVISQPPYEEVFVSGQTIPQSSIEIYENNQLIGTTKAKSNGYWSASCALHETYHMSRHDIYAVITSPKNIQFRTYTKSIVVDKYRSINLLSVEMHYRNHHTWMDPIVWDFEHKKSRMPSYALPIDEDDKMLVFYVDFSDNTHPSLKSATLLSYYSDTEEPKRIPLEYDEKIIRWKAYVYEPDDDYWPVNVGVEYEWENGQEFLDADFLTEVYRLLETDTLLAYNEKDRLLDQLDAAIEADDIEEAERLLAIIAPELNFEESDMDMDLETLLHQCDSMAQTPLFNAEYIFDLQTLQDSISDWTKGISIMDCQGIDTAVLRQNGYEIYMRSDSAYFYLLVTDTSWHMVDMAANISYYVDMTRDGLMQRHLRVIAKDSNGDFITSMKEKISEIQKIGNEIKEKVENIMPTVKKILSFFKIDLKDYCDEPADLRNNVEALSKATEEFNKVLEAQNDKCAYNLTEIRKQLKTTTSPSVERALKEARSNNIKAVSKNQRWTNNWFNKNMQIGPLLKKVLSVIKLWETANSMVEDLTKSIDMYYAAETQKIVADCPKALKKLNDVQSRIQTVGWEAGTYYTLKITANAAELAGIIAGTAATIPTAGTSLIAVAVSVTGIIADMVAGEAYKKVFNGSMQAFEKEIKSIACPKKPEPDPESDPLTPIDKDPTSTTLIEPFSENKKKVRDPSGYVYESVSTNRVENVQASIYYKVQHENIFGDIEEEDVLWDASEFDQENPLYTDKEGRYHWDVPQGLWQVRFEKEGYEPTQSEWLPVPPPQLEVNIPIVQLRQPEVLNAIAHNDAVDIVFDKYMQPERLNTDNILVIANGHKVEGSVTLLDEQVSYSVKNMIANLAGMVCDGAKPSCALKVSSGVDVPMAQTFQQTFDIEGVGALEQTQAPEPSVPDGSVVTLGAELSLSCTTEGAVIRYTMDGSTPDCMHGYVYNGVPLGLYGDESVIINAIACADGFEPSEVVQWTYTFGKDPTSVEEIETESLRIEKLLLNGQLLIRMPDGEIYNPIGQKIR